MNNKVFVVREDFDNCERDDCYYASTTIMAVTSTREEAEKIVDNLYNKIMSMKTDDDGKKVLVELHKYDDGTIYEALVSYDWEYRPRPCGSYGYRIEEFELGKVGEIES